jgi:glutamate--cysteine ligase
MHGLERESIRVTAEGALSQTPHPESLGSSLSHPFITTDFAEPQIEFRTDPGELHSTLDALGQIHFYATDALGGELLWPFSMPPRLPDREAEIPIANYGTSELAIEKLNYRNGLAHRYGRKKQTLSGVHYNFSLEPSVLEREFYSSTNEYSQSAAYFNMIRNLYRKMPFFTYLFGASPAFDKSFGLSDSSHLQKHKNDTYIGEFATSIRLSEIGYTSDVQARLKVSFDSLEAFMKDLNWAMTNRHLDYIDSSGDSVHLFNPNYLQNEQELYALFRPKQVMESGERLLDALEKRGTGYIETRLLDVDPWSVGGVDPYAIGFFHIALLDSLRQASPPLTEQETKELHQSHQEVVWRGRDPGLEITENGQPSKFHELGSRYCERLQLLAEEMDETTDRDFYSESLRRQSIKWESPELTPSGRIHSSLVDNDQEFIEFGLDIANRNVENLISIEPNSAFQKELKRRTEISKIDTP